MRAFLLAYFTMVMVAMGQSTYPYPQPKPLSGQTPNTVTRLSLAVGPSAYNNDNPAVWDTDIGGGLQSRLNEQDRLNTKWMRLGAIVLDQSDRTYYAVDYLPGTTTLSPWRALFTMDGQVEPIEDTSIYKNDGDLTGNREVKLGLYTLKFTGAGGVLMAPSTYFLDAGTSAHLHSDTIMVQGRLALQLRTPNVVNGIASNGWVLALSDKVNGNVEFVPPSSGGGTGPPDTSIYIGDGVLTGERTVFQNQHDLIFDGGAGSSQVRMLNLNNIEQTSANYNLTLSKSGSYNIKTPRVSNGDAKAGDVLTLNTTSGKADFYTPPAPVNIYNANGALNGPRTVNAAGNTLNFVGGAGYAFTGVPSPDVTEFTFQADTANFNIDVGNGIFNLATARVNNGTAKAGDVLTYQGGLAGIEFVTPNTQNIYYNNGTLQSDRIVTGAGKDISWNGIDEFNVNSSYLNLAGSGGVTLKTPGLAAATVGDVVTLMNKSTGQAEYKPAPNLYNLNGTLAANRTVEGAGRFLNITNISDLALRAQNTTISGSSTFNLLPPNTGSASANHVLTLLDPTTGRSEFKPLPTPTEDTSIYNANGTLNGDRTVGLGGKAIYWGGSGGGNFHIDLANRFMSTVKTNFIYASQATVIGGGTVQLGVPSSGVAAATGKVLTFTDGAGSFVDAMPSYNLYNSNGIVADTVRTVTVPSARWLTFDGTGAANNSVFNVTGFGISHVDGATNSLFASTELDINVGNTGRFRLRTPKLASASTGYYLMLTNASTGEAEWAPAPTPVGALNIYNSDGTLTGHRELSSGASAYHLHFKGANTVNGPNDYFQVYNWDRAIFVNRTNELRSSQNLWIRSSGKTTFETARTIALGAPAMAGHVLTMGSDGTVDFYPVGTPGVDKNIYDGDGAIAANRTVDVNSKKLTFTNSTLFLGQGIEVGLAASSKFYLKTPFGGARQGQYLRLVNSTTGEAEWDTTPNTDTSIYANNGSILGTRSVSLNSQSLTFNGPGSFSIFGASQLPLDTLGDLTLSGQTSIKLRTPKVIAGAPSGVAVGQVPILNNLDGTIEFGALPSSVNIYNQNGSLTTDRNVTLASKTLTFTGPGNVTHNMAAGAVTYNMAGGTFAVSGGSDTTISGNNSAYIGSPTTLRIATPKVQSVSKPAIGDVLTMQDLTGKSDFLPANNIYNNDGDLTTDRTFRGQGHHMSMQGLNNFYLDTMQLNLTGRELLRLSTPEVIANRVSAGMIFTSQDNTGRGEWVTPPVTKTFYTHDETITTPRTIGLAGRSLTWNAAGAPVAWNMASGNYTISGGANITLQGTGAASIEGNSSLKLRTPLVTGAPATRPAVGSILQLTGTDGSVDFTPIPAFNNFYNSNGSFDETRTVNGAGFGLTWGNLANFDVAANSLTYNITGPSSFIASGSAAFLSTGGNMTAAGAGISSFGTSSRTTGRFRLLTPLVQNATDALPRNGHVLTLAADGSADWAPATGGSVTFVAGGAGIYVGNSTAIIGEAGAGSYKITLDGEAPVWTTGSYIGGMRVSTQVTSGIADAAINDTLKDQWFRINSDGTYKKILGSDGLKLLGGDIANMVTLDLVFSVQRDAWLMVNTGWRSSGHTPTTLANSAGPNQYSGTAVVVSHNAAIGVNYFEVSDSGYAGGAYPAGMRITVKMTGPAYPGWWNGHAGQGFKVGSGPDSQILGADGTSVAHSAFFEGAVIDLMYVKNVKQHITGMNMGDAWIPANLSGNRVTTLDFPGMVAPKGTNAPVVVTFAGVVDTAPDLSTVPISFKKISTLGLVTVGDGKHADYYLTAFDPMIAPAYAVRSTIETNKMWRMLVAK